MIRAEGMRMVSGAAPQPEGAGRFGKRCGQRWRVSGRVLIEWLRSHRHVDPLGAVVGRRGAPGEHGGEQDAEKGRSLGLAGAHAARL